MELKTSYKQVENTELNGIELYFEAIPTKEEREALKSEGFRWHNVKKCWYKKNGATTKQPQAPTIKLGVEEMQNSYSGHGWEGVNSNSWHDITQVAKIIKNELKRVYPQATFSVVTDKFSGGQSLSIALIKDSKSPFLPLEEIYNTSGFKGFCEYYNTEEEARAVMARTITGGHLDVNYYYIDSDYRLTEEAKAMFKYAKELCDSFNYNDSDSMRDYFDCGFYMHLKIGRYEKPFTIA